jgi:serine/threonine protein kinase/Tol biopolymer transport system component
MLVGRRIGIYEIQALLGKGGMGEVYRARDTRLDRDVAIKILPPAFTMDPDRLARFEREARLLASLNHSHIGGIYGVEENDGVLALVLELIEGDTLADRIARGPVPITAAVDIAKQIVDALDAAHERGVIHRDLKPANINVTPAGIVKVLDFGLAKATSVDAAVESAVTIGGTNEGTILGTTAYMSPEQTRGHALDKRTDIWAFGCVLYEMLTGQPAFAGQTVSDTIATIIDREPDWSALPARTPPAVRRLLERCLDKDPRRRLRDIGDARVELEATSSAPAASSSRTSPIAAGAVVALVALVALAVVTGAVIMSRPGPTPAPGRASQFTLSLETQQTGVGAERTPVPSPDGQFLVFVANKDLGHSSLWLRALNSVDTRSIPGTDGVDGATIWSPDGRWIAFYAGGKLKKVSPSGGPPQTITELPGFQEAAWGSAGDILYRPTNRAALFRVSETGGPPAVATQLDQALTENSHRGLQFLPDGRRFIFTSRCAERSHNALYIGSLGSLKVKRLMSAQSKVSYVPPTGDRPGTLLYYRDGAIVSRVFDEVSETVTGDPIPVIDSVAYTAASILAAFQVSLDGRIAVVQSAGANYSRLTWFNRQGQQTGFVGPPGEYLQPRISPDGTRVAFSRPDDESGNRDIWYVEFARGVRARLTSNIANDWYPVWSPDGRQLLFGSDRKQGPGNPAHLKTAIDIGSPEIGIPSGPGMPPYDWSADGRWISFGTADLWVAPTTGDRKPFPFLATPSAESNARFSPDRKWIAYVSNETGRAEIYVRPFAGAPAPPEGRIQISNAGGDFPVWGPGGQELFYMAPDFALYAVSTGNLSKTTAVALPTRLFQACPRTEPLERPATGQSFGYAFDTHDGQRFLINCMVEPGGHYRVLMNWLSEKTSG